MAEGFSAQEYRVLRSAFSASDIDGDGLISKSDLQTSSGLDSPEDVEALFRAFKKEPEGQFISFEEFARGVMDFPFLLEQYRVELEERTSVDWPTHRRSNEGLTIDIDTIDEETADYDYCKDRHPPSPRFEKSLVTIQEFPNDPLVTHSPITQAYVLFTNLLQHRGTLSYAGSQSEYSLEDYIDMVRGLLSRIENRLNGTDAKLEEALFRGCTLLVEQLEKCVKTYVATIAEARKSEESLVEANEALKRRCEMAETRSSLLFDRLRNLENEMQQEQQRQESIMLESSRLQELLQSAHKQGQQTSEELREIQSQIETKEGQIAQLQQEVRRLTSRRVLREIPLTEDSAAVEVRNLRKERRTGGGTGFLSKIVDKASPISSPNTSPRSLLSSPFLQEKMKQSFRLSTHIKSQRRLLQDWEYQLKCKEVDLAVQTNGKVETIKAELEATLKQLNSSRSKVKELELALHDISLSPTQDASTNVQDPKLSVSTISIASVVKTEEKRRDGCCPAF